MTTYSKGAVRGARALLKVRPMRAEVIERFINIERLLDLIISQKYLGKDDPNFLFEVLYDEYFTAGLKIKILAKITDNHDLIEDARKLNNIRNYFAHLTPVMVELSKQDNLIALDPRDPKKVVDFEALYKEFQEKAPEVEKRLFDLYESLGGKGLRQPPLK